MNLELQAQSLLIATRKLLTPEERWQQRTNFSLEMQGDEPRRFCLLGGLIWSATKVMEPAFEAPERLIILKAIERLIGQVQSPIYGHGVTRWNDEPWRTHAEVLKLLDDTIGQEGK